MSRVLAPIAAFSALSLSALASPAAAQNQGSDVRCVLVSNLFARNDQTAQARQVALSALLFYVGRVTALPNAQLKSAMATEAKQITAANAGPIMDGCAQRMTQAMKELETTASQLQPTKP